MNLTKDEAKILYTLLNSLDEKKTKAEYKEDINNLKVKLEAIIFNHQYRTLDIARELKTSTTSILELKKRLGLYGKVTREQYQLLKIIANDIKREDRMIGLASINRYFSKHPEAYVKGA